MFIRTMNTARASSQSSSGPGDSTFGWETRCVRISATGYWRLARESVTEAGFRVERIFDFNRFSVPGWWMNGRVFRRRRFSRVQLKLIDMMMPFLRTIDRLLPWGGLSVIGIAVKE